MVAAVEASPVDPKRESGLTRVEGLLGDLAKSIELQTGLIKEQSDRISMMEQRDRARVSIQPRASGGNGQGRSGAGRGCYHCGDLSHFRRDCPQWLARSADGKASSGSENY